MKKAKHHSIIWILVTCNSTQEADKIGSALLNKRLVVCYDIFPRIKTAYFWPPKQNKIQTASGALLILETLPQFFTKIRAIVIKLHGDKLPFIGSIDINNISDDYFNWLTNELS